ncbi:hypothetical protein J1N35_033617 [Gossypium stocksii]|uniref:Uncharacterized protein n=1 Tax=Gossypium stocksii TaxID=47602 RepID=A0A9D3ZPN0_9ROSI|nr:hypothetical protein J1N35_033617 [Gossypium stocksii]
MEIEKDEDFGSRECKPIGSGNLPSYTWQSVWVVKRLLHEGLYWRVGTETSISTLGDSWVPKSVNYKIQDDVRNQNVQIVANLIDPNTNRWKRDVIFNTFSERDAEKVLKISFLGCPRDDHLAWRGEASGHYSMRSGYKLLIQGLRNPTPRRIHNT